VRCSGTSHVDPPSITVMNCAPTAAESFVWFHFHPAGSVYITAMMHALSSPPAGFIA
jgi:hypothetical protein